MSILEFEFLILTELNFVSTFVNYRQIQLGLEEISGNVHFVLKPWQVDLQRFKLTFYHTLDKNHFLVKNVTILVLLKVILLGMRRKYTKPKIKILFSQFCKRCCLSLFFNFTGQVTWTENWSWTFWMDLSFLQPNSKITSCNWKTHFETFWRKTICLWIVWIRH